MTPAAARIRLRALAARVPPALAGRVLAGVAALQDDATLLALATRAGDGEADTVIRVLLEHPEPPTPSPPGTAAAWMAERIAETYAKRGASPHPFGTGFGAIERAAGARKRRGGSP